MLTFSKWVEENKIVVEARKPVNPADYPHVLNALAGKNRKVLFSKERSEKKTRKGSVRWHTELM